MSESVEPLIGILAGESRAADAVYREVQVSTGILKGGKYPAVRDCARF
jgi:hypothetical protein